MGDAGGFDGWGNCALALDPHAVLSERADAVSVVRDERVVELARPSPILREILKGFAVGPVPPRILRDLRRRAGSIDRIGLDLLVARLGRIGALTGSVMAGDREVLRLRATGGLDLPFRAPKPDQPVVLSRFCHLRAEDGRTTLFSAARDVEAWIVDPRLAAALARLCRPATIEDLGTEGLAPDMIPEALGLLARAGVLEAPRAAEADHPLAAWEFHDLLFHRRSRAGYHDRPSGGTFRFAGSIPMPPLRAPSAASASIPLDRPVGPPPADTLFEVLTRRRSVRDAEAIAVSRAELADLLFHGARLTSVHVTPAGEVATRPYPSGGGLHELDIYLAVSRCTGLPPGIYRYEPGDHALLAVEGSGDALGLLLDDAAFSTGLGRRPDVLLIAAGRFSRLSIKYESIAYALMLKHVGCLVQTMYLVATALGIGCCAVGDGNARWFAEATGADPFSVVPVGEMIVCGRPGAAG